MEDKIVLDLVVKDERWHDKNPQNFSEKLHEIIEKTFSILDLSVSENQKIEISLNLINDAEIQELNKAYRNKDKPTDVLSFPIFEKEIKEELLRSFYLSLGDVFISLETLEQDAKELGTNLENHFY